MITNLPQGVSSPVIRNAFYFLFELNGLIIRTGGSSMTGKEYVYVNGNLISSKRTQSMLSFHEFNVEGNRYRIEFQVTSKLKAILACRVYCNDKLVKLFTAVPQHPPFILPLFMASIIFALLINDAIITSAPLNLVLALIGIQIVLTIIYSLKHIKIMELEVS